MFKRLSSGKRNDKRSEKGQVVVLIAVMITVLVGLAAMAIDLSYVFVQRRDMQNAADAGALAGARLVARFSANPTLNYRYRDLYYAVLEAAQANGANDITAYMINCPTGALGRKLSADDFTALGRPSPFLGIWVKTESRFGTFLSRMFGVNELGANAEAQAEFAVAQSASGVSPIGVQKAWLLSKGGSPVGKTFRIWSDSKEAGSTRGWMGLACHTESLAQMPPKSSTCSPDANTLKALMDSPYYQHDLNKFILMGGDPGTSAVVITYATNEPSDAYGAQIQRDGYNGRVYESLILPVYDYIYHYTTSDVCNPNSTKYDVNKCKGEEVFEGITTVYTPDSGYGGKYYYRVVDYAKFVVIGTGTQGNAKYIDGIFTDWVEPTSSFTAPCSYFAAGNVSFGSVVVKLTK
jgi:hypothetical protein